MGAHDAGLGRIPVLASPEGPMRSASKPSKRSRSVRPISPSDVVLQRMKNINTEAIKAEMLQVASAGNVNTTIEIMLQKLVGILDGLQDVGEVLGNHAGGLEKTTKDYLSQQITNLSLIHI